MAQIGSFTRGENDVYTGEIRTLTLRVKANIRPVERDTETPPPRRSCSFSIRQGIPDNSANMEHLHHRPGRNSQEFAVGCVDKHVFPVPHRSR